MFFRLVGDKHSLDVPKIFYLIVGPHFLIFFPIDFLDFRAVFDDLVFRAGFDCDVLQLRHKRPCMTTF